MYNRNTVLEMHRQTKPRKVEMRSVDAMATERYDALLVPLHIVLQFLAAVAIAVRVTSVQTTNFVASGMQLPDIPVLVSVTGGLILVTMLLLRRFTKNISATQRVAVWRAAYMAGDWTFRLTRICDLLAATDRAYFVTATAESLRSHFDWPTQWSCFLLGWLVGFMQPTSSRAWRVAFIVLAFLAPLLPGFVGWVVSSRDEWLVVSARLLFLSQGIGFLLELMQRKLLKSVLSANIRNELAIALPSEPLGSLSAVEPSEGGLDIL